MVVLIGMGSLSAAYQQKMRELSLTNCRLDRRYDLQRELGRGSYSEIFLARDTLASPQSRTTRLLSRHLMFFFRTIWTTISNARLSRIFRTRLLRLDRVRHPNIISRLGHGTARDLNGTIFHYLVLEYLAGGDLQKLCRRTPADAAGFDEIYRAGLRRPELRPQARNNPSRYQAAEIFCSPAIARR
jgi:hypothetical protein